jgi:hypothetical protein
VAAVIVSAVGYFLSIIAVFTTIMAFMTLLIGVSNPLTLEKVRHYPHPRPTIERAVAPTNPEPHHVRVALGTNEAMPAKDPSAQDKNRKDSHAPYLAKADAENRKPERKIKPERPAHLHQPKVLVGQRQNNYDGYGSGMALGYAEGYRPGLDSQR